MHKVYKLLFNLGKSFLEVIYFFVKKLPIKNKITLISRQWDNPSTDFLLIYEYLREEYPDFEVVMLNKKIGEEIFEKIFYVFHIFKQIYHIGTSRGVILDSYCIPISILKHRDHLVVIQMWHALGALKKFGYSILDMEEGSDSKVAEIFSMHKNYSYVLTSSEQTRPYFAEAFNVDEKIVLPYGLPRVDLFSDNEYCEKHKDKVFKKNPKLGEKEIILYAPTFRKDAEVKIEELVEELDPDKYNLILIQHHLAAPIEISSYNVVTEFEGDLLDALMVCDYLVTDYSAVVFEAAIMEKPMFFYAYDLEEYKGKRGFYINYEKEMPGVISDSGKELANAIDKGLYNKDKIKEFREKYVDTGGEIRTKRIVDLLIAK